MDFIIANHFLEHCEDPIGTIGVHLEKLRPGGVLFYAVPDMRYTFDFNRPVTPLDHLVRDHEEGPERSRAEHFTEWARSVEGPEASEAEVRERAARASKSGYSIHMHVWTQAEFLQLLLRCRERLDDRFEIEAVARQGIELVVVLRKEGRPRAAAPASSQDASDDLELSDLRRENRRLDAELRDVTGSASWRITRPLRAAKRTLHKRGLLRKLG